MQYESLVWYTTTPLAVLEVALKKTCAREPDRNVGDLTHRCKSSQRLGKVEHDLKHICVLVSEIRRS